MVQNRWLCPILYSGMKKSNFTGEHGGVSVHCRNVILKPWCVSEMWHLRSREAYQDNFTTTVSRAAVSSVGGGWVWRYPDWITLLKSLGVDMFHLLSLKLRSVWRGRVTHLWFPRYPSAGAESGSGTGANLWCICRLEYQFTMAYTNL